MSNSLIPQREEGRKEQGLKMGKGNYPKVNETQGFLNLVYSNWNICGLLNWFYFKTFPPFYPASHNKPFLITPKRGREEGPGAKNGKRGNLQKWMRHRGFWPWGIQIGPFETWKWGKRNHPKVNETQGFLTLGHSNWTICSLLSWFCPKFCPPFYSSYWEVQFLITPETGAVTTHWNCNVLTKE